ncbi:unnamed protein product, partial [Phaedon cochleariae]
MQLEIVIDYCYRCLKSLRVQVMRWCAERPAISLVLVILFTIILLPLITATVLIPFAILLDLSHFLATKESTLRTNSKMAARVPSLRELKKKSNSLLHLKNAKQACVNSDYAEAYENFVLYFESLTDPLDSTAAVQKIFTKLVCKMGMILEETCNIEELLKCYIQALNFFPDNFVILSNLGAYMFKNAEIDIARRYLERAVNVNKNYLPAEINLMHVKWHQIPRWHFRMLNDKHRNIAYEKAISTQVNTGYKNVLDIGAGCGFLSLCAARHAGTTVTAIEENKQLANMCKDIMKANEVSNVNVLQCYSTHFSESPVECNLLVTEVFDVALFGERALETIAHASTVLCTENDYKIIPCKAKVYLTGISSEELHAKHRCTLPRSIQLLNLDNLEITEQDLEPYEAENLSDFDVSYLTDKQEIFNIDFYDSNQILQILDESEAQRVHLKCNQAGTIHALAVWFDLGLTADVSITTDPLNDDRVTCWEQAVVHLDRPVKVTAGDVLAVDVSMKNCRLKIELAEDGVVDRDRRFKVTKEVVSFLNDDSLVESIGRLAERLAHANLTVVDYNVFPLLGFLMAKRNCTVFHSIKNNCDRALFERILDLNDIPKERFHILDEFVLDASEHDCLFFCDVISRDGLLESSGFEMMEPHGRSVKIPQSITAHVQLVHSLYVERCNLVMDENVLDFRIGEFINDYSGYEHPNLEKLQYTAHSEPIKFPLAGDGTATSRVTVNREGIVNALYVWYDVQLHDDIVFSTKNSTHYKKVCFFFKEKAKVQVGDNFTVKMQLDGSYVKIFLEEKEISDIK